MIDYKLQDLQQDVEHLANRLKNGCGNHGCVIKEPVIGTNGGCKCTPRQVMNEMLNLTCAIERMNNKGASWNK